jgi:acyl dehydratase
MPQHVFTSVADLERMRGQRVGESAWRTITQALVDEFAHVSGDYQWIHVDTERARRDSPFGTTIAHGFLTLSLLSSLSAEVISMRDARMGVNYGFDRVRFVAPVRVGSEVRGTFAIDDVRALDGGAQITWRVEVEIRGAPKPALSALWLTRVMFAA